MALPTLTSLIEQIKKTSPISIVTSTVNAASNTYFARTLLQIDRQIAQLLEQETKADGDVRYADRTAAVGALTLTTTDFGESRHLFVRLTTGVTYVLLPTGVKAGTKLTILCQNGLVPVGGDNGVGVNGIAGDGVTTPANPSTVTPQGGTTGGLTLVTTGTGWFVTGSLNLA